MRAALVLLLTCLTLTAFAAVPVQIAPNVHLLRGVEFTPGTQPDGNSILFSTKQGLVVVDTGRHAAHTRAILDFAAAQKKPLAAVLNTHWHLDHIGGNVLVRREAPGVKIYASPALDDALKGFLANYAGQLEQMVGKTEGAEKQGYETELALIQSGRQLAPDVVVDKSGRRTIAGRKLDVHLERFATTAGDLWIFDKASGTLVAGDLVTLPFPFLDTACPAGWKAALGRLDAVNFKLLVPGHGAPMTHKELRQYRTAFDNLLACGASEKSNADCANGWLADVGTLVPPSNHEFVRQAMDYYVPGFLRAGSKVAHPCGS